MSWTVDTAHTQIQFSVRHMMISKVRGQFEKFTGTVELDESAPANTKVEFQIDPSSINTREPQRDAHLRSADFFNAETYPNILFKGKKVELVDATHAKLIGDLTIRDITHDVTLAVEFLGKSKSPYGTMNYGFSGTTRINRKDWNLTWNVALETGGVLVGEDIDLEIELELTQKP
jgi:polyisoprenoid-binding protein YceI